MYEDTFDWYGSNYYSFETARVMIAEIRSTAKLLNENFDDPSLDAVKSHFPECDYDSTEWNDETFTREMYTAKHINEYRRKILPTVLDFYNRFCTHLEKMIQIPGNDTVSFSGP